MFVVSINFDKCQVCVWERVPRPLAVTVRAVREAEAPSPFLSLPLFPGWAADPHCRLSEGLYWRVLLFLSSVRLKHLYGNVPGMCRQINQKLHPAVLPSNTTACVSEETVQTSSASYSVHTVQVPKWGKAQESGWESFFLFIVQVTSNVDVRKFHEPHWRTYT